MAILVPFFILSLFSTEALLFCAQMLLPDGGVFELGGDLPQCGPTLSTALSGVLLSSSSLSSVDELSSAMSEVLVSCIDEDPASSICAILLTVWRT